MFPARSNWDWSPRWRPGGNVTGISNMLSEIGGKISELTREALPGRPRVAIFWSPDNPASAASIKNAPRVQKALGQEPIPIAIRSGAELDAAFERLAKERAQVISAHGAMWPHRHRILALAARHRLPVIGTSRDWARLGAILSYGPDTRDMPRLVAAYVAKILNGASPAEMPVQQPTKFELVVNLKTAKRLNLVIPETVLVRADEVIE
jgi:putative ABC transport system substrate-binding protein